MVRYIVFSSYFDMYRRTFKLDARVMSVHRLRLYDGQDYGLSHPPFCTLCPLAASWQETFANLESLHRQLSTGTQLHSQKTIQETDLTIFLFSSNMNEWDTVNSIYIDMDKLATTNCQPTTQCSC